MKTIKTLLLLVLGTVLMCACSSKDSYLNQFEKFISEVESHSANYTLEDWAGADAQFHAYSETEYQKYQDKLTPEDRNQLGRLTARYSKVRYKSALQQASDYVDDVLDAVEGFVEEMDEEGEDEISF